MKPPAMKTDIPSLLAAWGARVESAMLDWAAPHGAPAELAEALRYACGGGKRLRPALVRLTAEAVCGRAEPPQDVLPAAVAVELIHCYSLVHDDLPAMDDDVLRRGQPTVHAQYGEAMGILVGDALLTQAFAVLAERTGEPALAVRLAAELARGAGAAGMIAGQVADMGLCAVPEGLDGLEYIHRRKTSALFAAAARMGALCGGADANQCDALGRFAIDLGLAFQVKDDLLDATASTDQLGKTAGKDAQAGKRTYPALLGLEATETAVETLSRQAMEHLAVFGASAEPLHALAEYLLQREC